MNEQSKVQLLIDEIHKDLHVLDDLFNTYEEAFEKDVPLLGKSNRAAVLIAGLLENYYTCVETVFLRISQFFENDLKPDKWHTDLLHKMVLSIEGIRESVISDKTYSILLELLKFRHFKRYYYQLEYDWDKLEFLRKKLRQVHPMLKLDLTEFLRFLEKI